MLDFRACVWMTVDQANRYRDQADELGLSLAAWMRSVCDQAAGLEPIEHTLRAKMLRNLRAGRRRARARDARGRFLPKGRATKVTGGWGGVIQECRRKGSKRADCRHLHKCQTLAAIMQWQHWRCACQQV